MLLMNTEIHHCTTRVSGITTSLLRFVRLRICCRIMTSLLRFVRLRICCRYDQLAEVCTVENLLSYYDQLAEICTVENLVVFIVLCLYTVSAKTVPLRLI